MEMLVNRVARAIGLALVVVAAQILTAGTSSANHRPWPDLVPEADHGIHTFCFDPDWPSSTAVRDRTRFSMGDNDGLMTMTNITTDELAACTTSVDVRVQQRATGGSLGDTWCALKWANGRCDRFRVRIDTAAIAAAAADDNFQIRKTICHEIGHTVGLWHYGNGDPYNFSADHNGDNNCMRSGVWDSGATWTRIYGPHDTSAVNDNW